MRKLDVVRMGDELFEVKHRIPVSRFTIEINSENSALLKEYYKVDKVLRNAQTNEYMFANRIDDAIIVEDDIENTPI
jgi:hypothetical protein